MQRLVRYRSSVVAQNAIPYCQITALNLAAPQIQIPYDTQISVPSMLQSGTLLCIANAGVTGGIVAPVTLGPNGIWYALAAPTTLSAPGFGFFFQMTTSSLGLGILISSVIVGGNIDLVVEAFQV